MKKLIRIIIIVLVLLGGEYFFRNDLKSLIAPAVNPYLGRTSVVNIAHKFEFQYPKSFSGNVWHMKEWPPMVTVVAKDKDPIVLGCPGLKDVGVPLETTHGKIMSGLNYAAYKGQDAGAGSLYSTYCYVVQGTKNFYVFSFEVRSHTGCYKGGCGAYCGTQFEQECKNFDLMRDVEKTIQRIVSSIQEIK